MGKRSVKENKTRYQIDRENAGLTRDAASERLQFISADRLEKIESEKTAPAPEDIIAMGEAYHDPLLCNYYCSTQCPIGRKYVPQAEPKDLTQITLEALSALNALEKHKDRFIEIAADRKVTSDEIADFREIKEKLDEIAQTATSLRYWMDKETVEPNESKS